VRDVYDAVWRFISPHRGRGDVVSSALISKAVAMADDRGTRMTTRYVIAEMLRRGYPIGATGSGYFVLETDEEVEDYVRDLRRRAAAMVRRTRWVREAFTGFYPGGKPRGGKA
jgi:hypothetical protein